MNMTNKSLPQLNELYKEIILEHYRHPCGKVPVEHIHYQADGMNPLCGDEIKLALEMEKNKIKKIFIDSHGCSISVASASMLADILNGKTLDEAKIIYANFKDMMHGIPLSGDIDIGDLEALEGVKKFPVRIKCALLPWTTFDEALSGHKHIEIS
jgi:nitrogen fixation NifU-like protein